jgi:molybdopterin-guanine dinucleotide biosynthesis protein B
MNMQTVLGVAGWSGSGKTTLLEQLLPRWCQAGLQVSVIKHSHHRLDFDTPGKDSYRHRVAGAAQVMLLGEQGLAVYENLATPPDLAAQLARLQPVDLVVLEGQKWLPIPKIEVYRAALGKPLLQPDDPNIMAVASDTALDLPVPCLPLNHTDAIADFVLCWLKENK